jgi:hypothetical protein
MQKIELEAGRRLDLKKDILVHDKGGVAKS